MRYSSYKSVEYDLKLHYKLLDKYTNEMNGLSSYKGYILKQSKARGSKRYYSAKAPGMSSFNYIGGEGNEQMRLIRERAFYEKSIDVLHSNIAVMEDFLRIYKSTGAQHINELLGACYTLPQSSLLLRDDLEADDWLDFTFFDVFKLTANMLEHLGNWFHSNLRKRDEYRRDAIRKMDEYAKIGFFPGTNLFLTYGSSENKFDVQAIHRQIAMFASPPPSMETIEMLKRL